MLNDPQRPSMDRQVVELWRRPWRYGLAQIQSKLVAAHSSSAGTAGDWTDDGPCASVKVAKTNYRTAAAHASIPATAQTGPAPVPTIVVT